MSDVDDDLDINQQALFTLQLRCEVTRVLHFPIVHLSVRVCSCGSSVHHWSARTRQHTGRTSTCVEDDDALTVFVLSVEFWIC